MSGADDETRTRDPHLGKVMRYQLRYIRTNFYLKSLFVTLVRDTGIEPVTSSVSGKRATAAPIALTKQLFCCEVRTGFEPAYTALQAAA